MKLKKNFELRYVHSRNAIDGLPGIITASANVLNNNASKSKIMTNESKIHIDQIKSIKDVALMHLFINKLPGFCSSILALINNELPLNAIIC